MKLKFRIIFFVGILVATLLISKLSATPDSLLNWYIGTTKSELWALSQQLGSQPGLSEQQVSTASFSESINSPIMIAQTSQNQNKMQLPYSFPLGWYDSVDNFETLPKIAQEGMNAVIPYTGKSSKEQLRAYLDRAAAVGIKVLVEIPRDEVRRDHRWVITQLVKEFKTHPAVLGWYLFDEPEYIKMSPKILERVYQAIKAEDPQHTVAIAFGRLMHIRKYLKALDTVMYFRYPVTEDSPEFSDFQANMFSKMVNTAGLMAKEPINFWLILQGYGRDKNGRSAFKRRLPTVAESRYMTYSAILAQADGLFFWTHYRSQQQWIDSVLTPMMRELQGYLPTVTDPVLTSIQVDNSQVQAKLYQNSTTQDLLLIAINNSNSKLETAIAIKENKADSAQVLPSNNSINISQGQLSDTFEPYAVHVYRLQ